MTAAFRRCCSSFLTHKELLLLSCCKNHPQIAQKQDNFLPQTSQFFPRNVVRATNNQLKKQVAISLRLRSRQLNKRFQKPVFVAENWPTLQTFSFKASELANRQSVNDVSSHEIKPSSSQQNNEHSVKSSGNEISERGEQGVGEHQKYPEGKPNWEHLQHVAMRLSVVMPKFFTASHDFTFYREDVELIDRINNQVNQSVRQLWYHVAMIKLMATVRYTFVNMQVLNITPVLEDGTVRVRWRMEHLGAISASILFLRYGTKYKKYAKWLDGYAIFFVDGSGLVYRVVIDKVMPDDEKSREKKSLADKVVAAIGSKAAAGASTYLKLPANDSKPRNCWETPSHCWHLCFNNMLLLCM